MGGGDKKEDNIERPLTGMRGKGLDGKNWEGEKRNQRVLLEGRNPKRRKEENVALKLKGGGSDVRGKNSELKGGAV